MNELAEVYQACYRDPQYKMGAMRRARVREDVMAMKSGKTFLDVGCGRSEAMEMARQRGVVARGVEIVPELCGPGVLCADVCNLPLSAREFDYVAAYDMLEHLPEDLVELALDELFRVCAERLLISTNSKSSIHHGVQLHLTRWPRERWQGELEARLPSGGVIRFTGYGANEWHFQIELG